MVFQLFALLILVQTLPVEAGPRWIKALLSQDQCICSSNADFLKAFLHQRGEAAQKGLNYCLEKMGGTYILVRDILEQEQGKSL